MRYNLQVPWETVTQGYRPLLSHWQLQQNIYLVLAKSN